MTIPDAIDLAGRQLSQLNGTEAGCSGIGNSGKFARPTIWLSLSGGGLRAAIFHYGCMKRLYELGILGHVYAFSATSGGAIVAALLHKHLGSAFKNLDEKIFIENYDWQEFEQQFLRVVRKGLFAPTFLLVSAYVGYSLGLASFATAFLLHRPERPYATALLILAGAEVLAAFVLHAALTCSLLRAKAYAPSESTQRAAKVQGQPCSVPWSHRSFTRLAKMCVIPSHLRWQMLNLMAFEGMPLSWTFSHPAVYLTTVDLNTGKELVFTSGIFTDLSEVGCKELWENKTKDVSRRSDNIEVAQAVAASSAFPPLFRPVPMYNNEGLVGVFVDGGVLDNHALNVPKAFAVHVHPQRGRYSGGG